MKIDEIIKVVTYYGDDDVPASDVTVRIGTKLYELEVTDEIEVGMEVIVEESKKPNYPGKVTCVKEPNQYWIINKE